MTFMEAPILKEIGRLLLVLGLVMAAAGVVLLLADKFPWLGRLPGDVILRRGRATFYFPIVTCLLVSLVLTVLLNLFFRR